MASVTIDKRTGNYVIRSYAGVNPTTKRDRTISCTLSASASAAEIESASTDLDARAEVLKKRSKFMTISSIVHYYLDACKLTDMSPATLEPYRSYTRRHVDPRIGSVFFDRADAATFSGFYQDLLTPKKDGGAGLAISTVEKIHSMLSGCFSTLKHNGKIPSNPLLGVKVPRADPPEVHPLLPLDLAKLVRHLKQVIQTPVEDDKSFERYMFAVLIWCALNGGFRRGELAGFQMLHWARWGGEWGLRVARVLIQVRTDADSSTTEKAPKSLKSKRIVKMDPDSAQIIGTYISVLKYVLAEHGKRLSSYSPLFCMADGQSLEPRWITERFKEMAEDLQLAKGTHLHTLRHTHATYLINHGSSIKDIQERLGHASSKTTMDIYGHLLPGSDAKTAQAFAEVLEEIDGIAIDIAAPASEMFAPKCPLSGKTCARFTKDADST